MCHPPAFLRLVRLPGCGHVPMNDAPQQVAETILSTCAMAEESPKAG